jgi:hypothetical protein
MYDDMKISPHRNYVKRDLPEGEDVIYFLIIDEDYIINKLYKEIQGMEWIDDYRLEIYDSEEREKYKVLRVYHKNATHDYMQGKLMETLDVDKKITFGSRKRNCDVIIEDAGHDLMVKQLKKMYEPIHFTWKNILRRPKRIKKDNNK